MTSDLLVENSKVRCYTKQVYLCLTFGFAIGAINNLRTDNERKNSKKILGTVAQKLKR